jgi:AcrR family transcriptional regulator
MPDRPVKRAPHEPRRRAYHSPERARRASQTRTRIVAAARSLFLEAGYFPTSIRAIAAEAGVAEKTVYLAFKNKAALLDAVIDAAIGGADQPVPWAEERESILASPPSEILARFGEASAGVMERTARVLAMAEAAATVDPELAVLRERGHTAMRSQFRRIAAALRGHAALAKGISEEQAAATIYALANDSVYLRLVDGYGWSAQQYGRWLACTLSAALMA